MTQGETRPISVSSRYLYCAPASDLKIEAEARIKLDPNPFPDFSGYRFGPVNSRFEERLINLGNAETDENGNAEIALKIEGGRADHGAPLRADVVVGVIVPGGRAVKESARIPVRPKDEYLGLKLANGKSSFGQNDLSQVDAILLDRDGNQIAGEVEWKLVEEDYWFDWYRENGEWRWRRSYRDVWVAEGRSEAASDQEVRLIDQRLEPGSYRLSAFKAGSKAATDIRFYVGWRSQAASADSPDGAILSLQSENVQPGGRARLFLDAPYAGEANIVIATDRVQRVQRVKVGENGREIIVETDPAWGSGFYVMATVVTPRDPKNAPIPRRAMAVEHVSFDMSDHELNLELMTPELVRPRQNLNAKVKIEGAASGENVFMTLAAVDEGILRLTQVFFSGSHQTLFWKTKTRC